MAISSINFIPVKGIKFALQHNDRTSPPAKYFLPEKHRLGNEVDVSAKVAEEVVKKLTNRAKQKYSLNFGQKLQAKTFLWEAEVNLNREHDLNDVKELARAIEEETGFTAVQVAIHRDEGHINKRGIPQHNLHAHIVFFTLDQNTGEQLFRRALTKRQKEKRPDLMPMNKARMSHFQDLTAKILGMKRGKKGSKTKRLDHHAYREVAELKSQLQEQIEINLQQASSIENQDLCLEALQKEIKELRWQINAFKNVLANDAKGATDKEMKYVVKNVSEAEEVAEEVAEEDWTTSIAPGM